MQPCAAYELAMSKPARVRTQTLPHLALTTHRVPHGGESEAGEAPITFAESLARNLFLSRASSVGGHLTSSLRPDVL